MIDNQTLDESNVVRLLREQIRQWWNLEIAFADARGYVADHAHGVIVPPPNPFCHSSLTQSAEGFKRCNRSIELATQSLIRSGEMHPRLMEQCHLGFPIAMAPVQHMGRFYGSIFCSGFVVEPNKEESYSKILENSQVLNLPIERKQNALTEIPVLTSKDVDYLLDMMGNIVRELQGHVSQYTDHRAFGELVGSSEKMNQLYALLEKVANSDATVLITGANGTGKEVVARSTHNKGRRTDRAFVATNCSALNDNLLESELFGHVRGAFTGAIRDKDGLFKVADGGTLFLDEVGDMSPAMQVKLLRVLQERTFMPVGGTRPLTVDVRVMAATNRPLLEMVKDGSFREDLYYRLSVICVDLPRLRERKGDLPALCNHFLQTIADKTGSPPRTLSAQVMRRFWEYDWPGNIRQLQNEIERLIVLSGEDSEIGASMLSPAIGQRTTNVSSSKEQGPEGTLAEAVRQLEVQIIRAALVRTGWNKSRVARDLGMSRTTLIKKTRELGLEEEASING